MVTLARLRPLDVGGDDRDEAGERGECEGDTEEASPEQLHAPHLQSCVREPGPDHPENNWND